MNKFPYNNGHILIAPYRHVMDLAALDAEESSELMTMLQQCSVVLGKHFNPHGLNIGLNMGEAAGAGIREHLHFHIVPRWNGDSSFMALAGETRVIPQHLDDCWQALRPAFAALEQIITGNAT